MKSRINLSTLALIFAIGALRAETYTAVPDANLAEDETVFNLAADAPYIGNLTSTRIVKQGAGMLELFGQNSGTESITVENGTLKLVATPGNLTSAAFDFDASYKTEENITTEGTFEWKEATGKSFSLTSDGDTSPAIQTIGGQTFVGSSALRVTTKSNANPLTLFMVWQLNAVAEGGSWPAPIRSYSNSGNNYRITVNSAVTPSKMQNYRVYGYSNSVDTGVWSNGSNPAKTMVGGLQLLTVGDTRWSVSTTPNLWFGSNMDASLGEILGVKVSLGQVSRETVNAYLMNKWGINSAEWTVPVYTDAEVAIEANGVLDLGGAEWTVKSLTGHGTISNGTLTVTEFSQDAIDGLTFGDNVTVKDAAGNPHTPDPAVAKIGDVPYNTLAEAAQAASVGDTIILVKNVILDEEVSIPEGVALDLSGFTVNGVVNGLSSVSNGTLSWTGTATASAVVVGGTVTLTGGGTLAAATIAPADGESENALLRLMSVTLAGNQTVSVNVEVVKGTSNTLAPTEDNPWYFTITGNISGEGTLQKAKGSSQYTYADLQGDNSQFKGVFLTYCSNTSANRDRFKITPRATSADAAWYFVMTSENSWDYGLQSATEDARYCFGALRAGTRLNYRSSANVWVEVGGRESEETSFAGNLKRSTGAVSICKVGSNKATFSGENLARLDVQKGTMVLSSAQTNLDELSVSSGATFDLGGLTHTFASATIGGTITNGTLAVTGAATFTEGAKVYVTVTDEELPIHVDVLTCASTDGLENLTVVVLDGDGNVRETKKYSPIFRKGKVLFALDDGFVIRLH